MSGAKCGGRVDGARVEVLCDGYYYDVTEFVALHPGGDIIKLYTETGEDATAVVQQFHHRSISKVNAIFKSFKKRPALLRTEGEMGHGGLSADFVDLFLEIESEGLFRPSYSHLLRRILESLAWILIGILLIRPSNALTYRILGAFPLALGSAQGSFIMHEGGHNSLTGNTKIDKFIQTAICGLIGGISAGWWNHRHLRHHAMPQRLHVDLDLMETVPLLAYNAKVVKDPAVGKGFFIQNQKWLFLSIDCMLLNFMVKFYDSPKFQVERGLWLELGLVTVHWWALSQFLTLPTLALLFWLQGNYLFGNVFLGHTFLPVAEAELHWLHYALLHTANIEGGWLVDWFMGYLNLQIEHHLFPTLPNFRLHLVVERVRALARKHKLPYQLYTYSQAVSACLNNFDAVAKQLKTD